MSVRTKALHAASFRGVPFKVEAADIEAGRRNQVHEYPGRDKPYSEDLGRATRYMHLVGFVIGDDYVAAASRLLAALETAGPGELVHPWHGTMQVSLATPARVSYSRRELGKATFEMDFVEAGELVFPSASVSSPAQSRVAADTLTAAAVDGFTGTYDTAGQPDFVAAQAVASGQSLVKALGLPVPGLEALKLSSRLADVSQAVLDTAADPSVIAGRLVGALSLTGLVAQGQRWSSIVHGLLRLLDSPSLSHPGAARVQTPSRVQAVANQAALNALARQAVLAQAVGASSVMPATVYDETRDVRDALVRALDRESLTAGDGVFPSLQAARAAVWQDLTERARNAARLRSYTPRQVMPALALAYDLYGDAAREEEICARNRVRHPGFVHAEPLKVLAS